MEPLLPTPAALLAPSLRNVALARLRWLLVPVIGAVAMLTTAAAPIAAAQDTVMSGMLAISNNQNVAVTAAPQAATPKMDAAALHRVEGRICRAETNFQLGLDEYRAANAGGHYDSVPGREHLRQAKAYFLLARDDLDRALPAFGDTAESADADRRQDAIALRAYNERLLLSVERAEEP